jgi:two-component system sensor histidine kinase YesM
LFTWINKSLKNKAFIILILLGVLPLLISGIIINVLTSRLLVQKMNYMAEQTIDKLSLLVSKDLQGFIDIAFYSSQNKELQSLVSNKLYNDEQKQKVFYNIYYEVFNKQLVNRIDYPYQYIVITKDNNIFTNFSYLNDGDKEKLLKTFSKTYWYNSLLYSRTQKIIISSEPNYLSSRSEPQLYICVNIVKNMEPVGILLIGVDRSYISKLLENVRISKRSSIFIVNKDECMVESESNYISFEKIPKDIINKTYNNQALSINYKINGSSGFVNFRNLYIGGAEGNWKIIMITPAKDITRDVNYINYIIFGMIALSIIAVLFLMLLINRHIINPVIGLHKFAKEAEEGNLDVRANYNRKDEIGKLALMFNNMLEKIKQNITDIKEKEEIKRKMEINVLQSQINPHFVYNTLNIVRWMAEMMKVPSIGKALVSIAGLIKYNYDIKDSAVPVKTEIKHIEEYIYLQKLRYQNKFISKIEIDNEILDCAILKLILQPVVENSIIHGLEKKKGLGTLTIKGQKIDGKLVFTITDDGVGISKENLKKIFQADKSVNKYPNIRKIGLANVIQRIKLNYGDEYGLTIISEQGIGTEVKITLPFIKFDPMQGELSNENTDN